MLKAANAGSKLTAANAVVGLQVHASGSGDHRGGGKLLGWKVHGVRHGNTSGGALLPALRPVPCMACMAGAATLALQPPRQV